MSSLHARTPSALETVSVMKESVCVLLSGLVRIAVFLSTVLVTAANMDTVPMESVSVRMDGVVSVVPSRRA